MDLGLVSTRAGVYLKDMDFLVKCFISCAMDTYDKDTNPGGMVNLGTAVNSLCEEVISSRLERGDLWQHQPAWQHYFGLNGTPDLLRVTADFLQQRLAQGEQVCSENLRLVNGVSGGLEVLSWVLADPGDVVIVPTPTYARFFADMNERMKTCVVGMHLEDGFTLTSGLLEKEITRRKLGGEKVKAFIYCNPNNPLGVVYPKHLTLELMEVCKRHQVHFISDEIYALSVFDKTASFTSVLSIPNDELPDPSRTHVLWGLSKDFGLAGFRMGFIHSHSKELINTLDGQSMFTCSPVHMQQAVATLLKDTTWLDTTYFPTNLSRMASTVASTTTRLEGLGVTVMAPQAGLFLWADFSKHLRADSQEAEMELFQEIFDEAKVYLVPGSEFYSRPFGWFRIIFSVQPQLLEEGLARIELLLAKRQHK